VSIALRVLVELHKAFRQRKGGEAGAAAGVPEDDNLQLEQYVAPYLDFVRKVSPINQLHACAVIVRPVSSRR
jgi:hypothetical protein